jgi:peptidoglycan/LPS O-acetylase OafA/YrhL
MSLPNRIYSLDIARGIAALSIVFWHWRHYYYNDQGELIDNYSIYFMPFYTYIPTLYKHMGILSLYFFFTLSGFVFFWLYAEKIANRRCTFKQFTIARFARLYPLHLLTLILVGILQSIYWGQSQSYFVFLYNDLYHFMLQLLMINSWGLAEGHSFNGPFWTVSLEIMFYLFFFTISFFRLSRLLPTLIIFGIIFLIRQYGGRLINVIHAHAFMAGFECFMLGGVTYFCTELYLSNRFRSTFIDIGVMSLICVLWLSLLCEPIGHYMGSHYDLFARTFMPLTIFALVIGECVSSVSPKPFHWIGEITYSVYLLHFPLQIIYSFYFREVGASIEIYKSPWVMASFFIILIPMSWLTYQYFESPMRTWLRQRLTRE